VSAWDVRVATPPPVRVERAAGRYSQCFYVGYGDELRARRGAVSPATAPTEWPEEVVITEDPEEAS